jgi:FkbM family methyltransferase
VPAPVAGRFTSTGRAARLVRPLVNLLLTSDARPITVRSGPAKGIKLVINPRREKYYWTGTYERRVQEQIALLLRPGNTFWDVGAHIGFFTLLAARVVGESGLVQAFEPFHANRARLLGALELNHARNVALHDCALAAESCDRMLFAHEASSMWTLVPERGEQRRIRVDCRTLDELEGELGPPDLIKIDVEGAEIDVLRGGSRLLTERKPPLIVEFSDDSVRRDAQKLLNGGYKFASAGSRHWVLTAEPHP